MFIRPGHGRWIYNRSTGTGTPLIRDPFSLLMLTGAGRWASIGTILLSVVAGSTVWNRKELEMINLSPKSEVGVAYQFIIYVDVVSGDL